MSTTTLEPLTIALPLLFGCVLIGVGQRLNRVACDLLALLGASTTLAVSIALLLRASGAGPVPDWVGGWYPRQGFSVGIVLVADPVAAGAAVLAAGLAVAVSVYGWRYFDDADAHYQALILLFLAGMVGFALSGDLFDMFVFFELMGAAAYALTGFRVEERSAVQGALNFGIVNSLAAYLSLMGVGILYARAGNLTLPVLHRSFGAGPHDALVTAAFVTVLAGFLVKGALVPFHFWLADAHAVAPTPVCVLFSGVMVPLGTYAVFRVYWLVFQPAMPADTTRRAFLVLGAVTAVLGAVLTLCQTHLKRLLAYSTIAHVGLFTFAAGLLTAAGTAGALLYAVGHACVKGALFLAAGTLLNRYGSVDEGVLFGRVDLRWTTAIAALGGLALAGLPPFATGLGKALAEEAGSSDGVPWAPVLFVGVSAATGGAVLRAVARVCFGLGVPPRQVERVEGESAEQDPGGGPARFSIVAPGAVLLALALAIGLAPGTHAAFDRAGEWFVHPDAYTAAALQAVRNPLAPHPSGWWTLSGAGLGVLSAVLAVAVAAVACYRPGANRLSRVTGPVRAGLELLRQLHSGHVGDYVAWLLTGLAGLVLLLQLPPL